MEVGYCLLLLFIEDSDAWPNCVSVDPMCPDLESSCAYRVVTSLYELSD